MSVCFSRGRDSYQVSVSVCFSRGRDISGTSCVLDPVLVRYYLPKMIYII